MKSLLILGASVVLTTLLANSSALANPRPLVSVPSVAAADTMPRKTGKAPRKASRSKSAAKGTATQEARYRNSSADDGTAVNNSNVTNYNTNAATNPATGVGSVGGGASATPKPKKKGN